VRRDVVILACAISAGIHAALTPEHAAEGTAMGVGFASSAAALAALALVLTADADALAVTAAAGLFATLIAGYFLAVTTGLPVLHPNREPVDDLALFTKGVEAAGLFAAADLLRRGHASRPLPIGLTALVGVFSALVALSVSGGHHAHG
jgi:energy-converting hydrogenase Eha subunit A